MAEDLQDVIDLLERLSGGVADKDVILDTAREIRAKIDARDDEAIDWLVNNFYPPPRDPSRKFRFATDKQRRAFWAMVKRGLIQVPYRRTLNLLRAIDANVLKVSDSGFVLQIGINTTKAPYAPFVVGEDQIPGHGDTGWPIIMQRITERTPVQLLLNSISTIYVDRLGTVIVGRSR
jgi:hypothetical protein